VAVGPCILVGDHVEGRQVVRCSDVATRGSGGATQRHSLSTCHPDGAPVSVEEDAATVTKLLFVCLITKGRKVIVCLLVERKKSKRK
jgi:hypothetical protein